MKGKYIALTGIIALMSPMAAYAQQLHESVNVEGVYKVEVIQPERINVYPRRQEVNIDHDGLRFDTDGVPAQFEPTALPLAPTAWRAGREISPRGYVDVSLGSWLNSSVSAGYSLIRKPATTLDVAFQHCSTSLWKPSLSPLTENQKRWRYNEAAEVLFSHEFKNVGLFEAGAYYRFGYFNYYTYRPDAVPFEGVEQPDGVRSYSAPSQTLNDMAVRVGLSSPAARSLFWRVDARARYFGYRQLYMPGYDYRELRSCKAERETHLSLTGGIGRRWQNEASAGIDADLNVLLYTGKKHILPFYYNLHALSDYGMLSLKPYYKFGRKNIAVKIGADVDLTLNADGTAPGNHYKFFHIAPDMRADWTADRLGAYLRLGGGSELQTLSLGETLNYYRMPALSSTQPVYTPIDAMLGIEAGPFSGLRIGGTVGYRVSRHVPLDGWYMTMLNYGPLPVVGLPDYVKDPTYGTSREGLNMQGFTFGLSMKYNYSSLLEVKGDAHYQPQHDGRGWFNGLDRPRWILDASALVHPVEQLSVGVGYEYRGVRTVYTRYIPEGEERATGLVGLRLPDIANLKASASWKVNSKLTVGIEGYNLLGKHFTLLPCLRSAGVDIQGRITYLF